MDITDAAFQLETPIALAENEVHLWRVDLARVALPEQRWEKILSADERKRAARFHFSQDRQYFTATRALLRIILGGYVDSDPTELTFRYSEQDKPLFSVSTSATGVRSATAPSEKRRILGFREGG